MNYLAYGPDRGRTISKYLASSKDKPKEKKPEAKKRSDRISKALEARLRSNYKAPCTCDSRECGYPEHDSLRMPPQQSSKQSVATTVQFSPDSSTLCGEARTEELHHDPPISEPPSSWVDPTLLVLPLHWSVSDHLCFNKLASAQRKLYDLGIRFRVEELSATGSVLTNDGALFNWWNHVYLNKGSFEQESCIASQIHTGSPENYVACPHQSLSVSEPTFETKHGWKRRREVQAWVTCRPPRCPSHPMERWSELDGPYTHKSACGICDVVVECTIDVSKTSRNRYLRVRYSCRRGLGAGLDPSDPKWVALMTGKGEAKTGIDTQA